MDFSTIFAFLCAAVLLTLAPGPDILFVLTKSMAQGAKSGVLVAFGLVSGVFIYSLLASLGVLALVRSSKIVFEMVRYLGAAYLLYLAWRAWQSRKLMVLPSSQKGGVSFFSLYRTGLLMSLLNPKLMIFFLAFFPQFVNLEAPDAGQNIFILGIIFCVQAFFIMAGVAVGAARVAKQLREKPQTAQILNMITALVLFLIAVLMLADGIF